MATFNKVNSFAYETRIGTHVWGTDTFKATFTNTAPATSDTVWSTGSFPAPASANGYTSGGYTLSLTFSESGGVSKIIAADFTATASGGSMGPFRYVQVRNSSKSDKIVGWYDYGSSITLADTETFTVDFDGTNGFIQIS